MRAITAQSPFGVPHKTVGAFLSLETKAMDSYHEATRLYDTLTHLPGLQACDGDRANSRGQLQVDMWPDESEELSLVKSASTQNRQRT